MKLDEMIKSGKRLITYRDHTVEVEVLADGRVETTPGADPCDVARVDRGRYSVSLGGRRARVYVAGATEAPAVFFEGAVYELEVAGEAGTRRQARLQHELLESPMPATVVQIMIAPGQRVERGETLLTLEAMKMQMPIRAPRAGLVSAIRCGVGDLVQPGVPLIELDEDRRA